MIRLKVLFCLVVLINILQACGIIIGNAQSCPTVCVIIPETKCWLWPLRFRLSIGCSEQGRAG